MLAYAVDTVGGEKFTLHVLDLASGKEVLSPLIEVLDREKDLFGIPYRDDYHSDAQVVAWRSPYAAETFCCWMFRFSPLLDA